MSEAQMEESNPKATITSQTSKVEVASAKQFSLDKLWISFDRCLKEDKSVHLEEYMDGRNRFLKKFNFISLLLCFEFCLFRLGYHELYQFLNLLGTVFGWVATDVLAKMEVVQGHQNGENGDKYLTVQSMLQHEIDNKLIKHKAKDSNTGTRNLLRLHRALEYIIAFLEGVQGLEAQEKCCPLSQEAYKKTLMKYHPWVVQKVHCSRTAFFT